MGARDEQRATTHAQILESAARLLRTRGLAAATVTEVMGHVGLTVGGFYAHFASKEALLDQVLRHAAADMRARLLVGLEGRARDDRFEQVLKRYLCRTHRDRAEEGCPLPAVAGEVATRFDGHRDALTEVVEALQEALAMQVDDAQPAAARSFALGMVALLYGALTLSRAVQGTALSDEILRSGREFARLARRGARAQATAG